MASPWQNGFIESFYGRFKHEPGDLNRFETVGGMIEAIYRHIRCYNHSRFHSALKMPPAVYACAGYLRRPDRILRSGSPLVVMMQTAQNRNASELREWGSDRRW